MRAIVITCDGPFVLATAMSPDGIPITVSGGTPQQLAIGTNTLWVASGDLFIDLTFTLGSWSRTDRIRTETDSSIELTVEDIPRDHWLSLPPSPHANRHAAGGPDAVTPAAIGAAPAVPPAMSAYESLIQHNKRVLYQYGSTLYASAQSNTFTVYKSTDFGQTWTAKGALPALPRVMLRVEASGTLIAVENTNQGLAGQNPKVWRSTDDGANWTQVTTIGFPPLSGSGITATPSGAVLIAEYGNVGTTVYRIMRSTDDGQTWTAVLSSPGSEPAGDPGHIHSVTWDPVASCFVAFMDRPIVAGVSGPRIYKSTDDGGTWTLIGESIQSYFPNFVAPMYFATRIAWGSDDQLNGRIWSISRSDFYAGNFAAATVLQIVNRKASYYTFPLRSDVWALITAGEVISTDDGSLAPGSYGEEVYLVSSDGTVVTGGLQQLAPATVVGTLSGLKPFWPSRHYAAADHGGQTWINLSETAAFYGYASMPVVQGWNPPMPRIATPQTARGVRKIIPGRYYGPGAHTPTTIAQGAGVLTAIPFLVPERFTADRISCEVTTGAGSSVVRLGVYDSSMLDGPNVLLLDAGTVDASGTGVKEVTIALTLQPGLYWLAAVAQGGGPTLRTVGSASDPLVAADTFIGSSATAGMNCLYRTGITGTLTDWSGGGFGSQGYKVMLRAAA